MQQFIGGWIKTWRASIETDYKSDSFYSHNYGYGDSVYSFLVGIGIRIGGWALL